jgi:TIGR03009 family protein
MLRLEIVSALLLTCTMAFAKDPQTPASRQNLDCLDPALVQHLRAWEASLRGIRNFAADATLTKVNLVTKREEKFDVRIWMMKPQMARLNLRKSPAAGERVRPDDSTAFIRNGTAAYHYDGENRLLTKLRWVGDVKATPAIDGGHSLELRFERWIAKSCFDNLLDFFENLSAQRVVDRYTVGILKQDDHYLYLELTPRNPIDKADFESMTIVLCLPSTGDLAYVPRMIQLKKEDGRQIETWDFPTPKVNMPQIKASHFEYVVPPRNWKIQEVVLPKMVPEPPPETVAHAAIPAPACLVPSKPVTTRQCHRWQRRCWR